MKPTVDSGEQPVVSNELLTHPYWRLTVAATPLMSTAKPGQFFHLRCPVDSQRAPFLRRPMSVNSIDSESGQISFLYKVGGVGTEALATLRPGDSLGVLGPLGVGFTIPPGSRNALILARGVGLATMAPLAAALPGAKVELTTICSYRDRLVAVGDQSFAKYGSVLRVYDTDRSSDPERVRSLILDRHRAMPFDTVYTCGSRRLTSLIQDLSAQLGLFGQVAVEQRMACGLGMCHACVVPIRDQGGVEQQVRVCTDGPVFGIEAIV